MNKTQINYTLGRARKILNKKLLPVPKSSNISDLAHTALETGIVAPQIAYKPHGELIAHVQKCRYTYNIPILALFNTTEVYDAELQLAEDTKARNVRIQAAIQAKLDELADQLYLGSEANALAVLEQLEQWEIPE